MTASKVVKSDSMMNYIEKLHLDLNGNIENVGYVWKIKYFSSEKLLKLRVFVYCVNLFIVLVNAYDLLTKDFKNDEDPRVANVENIRFRFGTIWNYIIFGCYLPFAIVVDVLEMKRSPIYSKYAEIRHFWMTALTATPTAFVSVFFWLMWTYDRELIVPSYLDGMVGMTNQHCLHTITLATVLFDLASVPRMRPSNYTSYKNTSLGLMLTYTIVIIFTYIEKGIWIYPFLGNLNILTWPVFVTSNVLMWTFLSNLEWWFIDLRWRNTKCL